MLIMFKIDLDFYSDCDLIMVAYSADYDYRCDND